MTALVMAPLKGVLRRWVDYRYGTFTEIYYKAVTDRIRSSPPDFQALTTKYDAHDERIRRFHVSSTYEDINVLKVKIRMATTWQFVTRCTGGIRASDRIIDVGAASGLFLEMFAKKGLGVELFAPHLEAMREYGVDALACPAEALAVPDVSFDYGFCFETLEHAESPLVALRELARVCTKGIFVSIPLLERSRVVARRSGSTLFSQHIFELSPTDFQSMATHAGLAVEDRCDVNFYAPGWGVERLLRRRMGLDKPGIVIFHLRHAHP